MLNPTRVLRQTASRGRGLSQSLTPKQAELERDRYHLRVAYGARQWGKSTWQCISHGRSALPNPGVVNLVLASSVHKAIDLTFPTFERLNIEQDAGFELLRGDHMVRTRAGGVIKLLGMSTLAEAEKIRGFVVGSSTIEECFVAGTLVNPIGKVLRVTCRPAPYAIIVVDGVASTPDHPYLTPEGWKRAADIIPGDMLCVWGDFSSAGPIPSAGNLFESLPLRTLFANGEGERDSHETASTFCKSQGATRGGDPGAANRVRSQVFRHPEAHRSQTDDTRRERPWAFVAGVPADECDWLGSAGAAHGQSHQRRPSDELQVGPCRTIGEVGSGDRWHQSQGFYAAGSRSSKGRVASWQRVDRVEVHERGGAGEYERLCPDGKVYNLTTESGFYFAGGRLVHNCGTYRDQLLEYAVNSCLRPAQMRYFRRGGRGTTALGTPSRNLQTYWHKMCLGLTGARVHFATAHDNPFIPDVDAYLRQVLRDNRKLGWTESTPEFRREYKGEFCADSADLPFGRWDGTVLPQRLAPAAGFTILTLDFGQKHPNAWTVHRLTTETATDEERRRVVTMHKIHLLHASQQNKMGTDEVVARTREIATRFNVNVMRGDSGGGGAQSIFDLQNIYSLPIEPVVKRREGKKKADAIYLYDSLLGNDTIAVYEDTQPWQRQATITPWNEDKTDFDPNYPDHCLDASLYSLDDLTAHMSEEKAEPLPGTPEWEEQQEKKRWEERIEYWRQNDA